jgi:hypothetical protein
MKQYKKLQMKFSQKMDYQKAAVGNLKIMKKYFNIFKKVVRDYKVETTNIWNIKRRDFL